MFKSIFVLSTRLFSQITREQEGRLERKIRPIRQLEDNALSAACGFQGSPWVLRWQISSERS